MNPFRPDDTFSLWPGISGPIPIGGAVWYPLNRTGGQQQDFGSGNFDIAAPTGAPALASGFFGPAVRFSSGNYYRSTNAGPYLAKNWTLSAWVVTTSLAAAQIIICRGTNGLRSFNMLLDVTTGKVVVAFTTSLSVFKTVTSNASVSVNIPTHVAGSYDGANLRVYINGVQDNFTAETGTPSNQNTIGVGTYGSAAQTEPFVGTIFDLRVYERALQPGEVNSIYNSSFGRGVFEAGVTMLSLATSPPPKGGGKPDEPPGKGKKAAYLSAQSRHKKLNRDRLTQPTFASFLPQQYLSPPKGKGFVGTAEHRSKMARDRKSRDGNAATSVGFLPQEYVPPGHTVTVWRDIVKIIKV